MESTRPAPLEGMPSARRNDRTGTPAEFLVELEVVGRLWWPTWIGTAVDSHDATRQAEAWFFGQFQAERAVRDAYPLRVRAVLQLPGDAHA